MSSSSLSSTVADFDAIRQQLIDTLTTYQSAKTAISAQTMTMLLEWVAGGTAYNQLAVERAVQELRRDDASDPLTIYKMARTLGVPILRYRPGVVTVLFTNPTPATPVSIPAYSQFVINGVTFVNTAAIAFAAGVATLTVTLTEGTRIDQSFTASGQPYQVITLGAGFNLSNDLLLLSVNGVAYQRVTNGLWNYGPTDLVFNDSTTPSGGIQITLGSGINGVQPTAGATLAVTAFQVAGASTNTTATGLPVVVSAVAGGGSSGGVTGVTTTAITGAENDRSIDYYRFAIPQIFAAAQRCVRRSDFTLLTQYPQVQEVRAVGEADVARGDYRWNTTVGVVVRTAVAFTQAQKDAFVAYAQSTFTVYGFNLIWIDPEAVLVRPIIELVVDPLYDSGAVIASVQYNINSFYANRRTTPILGKVWYPGSLSTLITSVPGVVDFDMSSPFEPVACNYKQYVDLDPTYQVTAVYQAQ